MKKLCAIACGLAVLLSGSASAADSGMFKGKTITYLVAAGPGGGYDSYGRLIAKYLQRHLPGSRVLVRNIPAASAIKGANMIYAADPDGLTMGMFNPGLIYDELLKRDGIMFDLTKFSWLGKAAVDTRALLISNASGFKNFDEMLASRIPVKFASADIGSASYIEARIIGDALHLNLQIIPGFTANEGEMSMLRKEVMAEEGTADSMQGFVDAGHGFWGLVVAGGETALPRVPRAMTYAKDDRARRLITLVETVSSIARPTAGPPGIPADILAVERDALSAVMRDPEFLADAKKLMLPIEALPGNVVETKIRQALDQTPETITFLKEVATKK